MRSVRLRRLRVSGLSSLAMAATALFLGGCSSSVERFADNPSDSDPVYTASVNKQQATPPVRKRVKPLGPNVATERVSRRPLESASLAPAKPSYAANGYNYQQAKQAYKQPTYGSDTEPADVDTGAERDADTSLVAEQERDVASPPKPVRKEVPFAQKTEDVEPQATKPAAAPAKTGATHTVASGETLYSLGRRYKVSPFEIAKLNGLDRTESLITGQTVRIPSGAVAGAPAKAEPEAQSAAMGPKPTVSPPPAAPTAAKKQVVQVAQVAPEPEAVAAEPEPAPAAPVVATSDSGQPSFRWPVKGKIISGYGPKANGMRNEGINIAVPEGTTIRSAETGIVAYAGNELKGYGNLVLVRHEGGWVTAYAHAKELYVKKGDPVKRGDVLGKAGQTGSVASPQVHFEVRRGATAVDPQKFLGSATAAN